MGHFRFRKLVRRLIMTGLAVIVGVVFAFPIYWIAAMALQDAQTAAALPPRFIFTPGLSGYQKLFQTTKFPQAMINSSIITIGTTVVALLLGTPAAYTLARSRERILGGIAFSVLAIRMLPGFAAVVPLFIMVRDLGLYGSHVAIIIAGALGSAALVTWLMQAFFEGVPAELDEAAMIDGCSLLGAVWRVILPLASPGLVAATVIVAIGAWNEFLFVLVLGGEQTRNMQVLLANFVTEQRMEWRLMASGGTLTMVPAVVFGLLVQKYFLMGWGTGATKG